MADQDASLAAPQRKLLGAFYTGSETASAIAQIAINDGNAAILDPCFGGCAFLEAVRVRLRSLGKARPMERVFGVDVDPGALAFLRGVQGARATQFLVKDFLDVTPHAFRAPFDVIVGNPPFVRHHLLSADAVTKGQARIAREVKVPRTADSWLYFLHHSLGFLRPGGCLAMVLPGALLNASYAATAREMITTRFASCELFLVRRRLFPDALESPVIVVARGFGEKA
jgi:adenine-specific DNA-methyltransferase